MYMSDHKSVPLLIPWLPGWHMHFGKENMVMLDDRQKRMV